MQGHQNCVCTACGCFQVSFTVLRVRCGCKQCTLGEVCKGKWTHYTHTRGKKFDIHIYSVSGSCSVVWACSLTYMLTWISSNSASCRNTWLVLTSSLIILFQICLIFFFLLVTFLSSGENKERLSLQDHYVSVMVVLMLFTHLNAIIGLHHRYDGTSAELTLCLGSAFIHDAGGLDYILRLKACVPPRPEDPVRACVSASLSSEESGACGSDSGLLQSQPIHHMKKYLFLL